jgi:chemotaxis signal transduction protein
MADGQDHDDLTILAQRAAELAAPLVAETEPEQTVALLVFNMFGASYAVDLDLVDAVTRIGEIYTIPLTPQHITGVIRRRGETIALVSLRQFFHPEAEGFADSDFALIVRARGKRFAIQVDDIEGVFHVPSKRLLAPPDNFDRAQAPYLEGLTTDGLVVFDLDKLVAAERFSVQRPVV